MYETLLYQQYPDHAVINLNRPEVRNAVSSQMMEELSMALDEAQYGGVHCLIIVGTGNTFCAGADLKEVAGLFGEAKINYTHRAQLLLQRIEGFPVPVIAAMNGHAFGGGLELALACDIRVTVPGAKFGLTEVKFGLNPAWGGSQRLPRTVGLGLSKYMVLTAEPLSSEEALQHGLVSAVVPREELMEHCSRLAKEFSAAPLKALSSAKSAIMRCLNVPDLEAERIQLDLIRELVEDTSD